MQIKQNKELIRCSLWADVQPSPGKHGCITCNGEDKLGRQMH